MLIFKGVCNQQGHRDSIKVEDMGGFLFVTIYSHDDYYNVELTQESSLELAHAIIAHYAKENK